MRGHHITEAVAAIALMAVLGALIGLGIAMAFGGRA